MVLGSLCTLGSEYQNVLWTEAEGGSSTMAGCSQSVGAQVPWKGARETGAALE